MGVKYEWISAEIVSTTAEALKAAAAQLTQVAFEMQQNNMEKALFPWTQRQWDCQDVVLTLASQCTLVLPTQILAKKQNRKSQYEVMQEKSKRDIAARKVRNAAKPDAAPKKRGRPKKK